MRNHNIAYKPLARYALAALLSTASIASQAECVQRDLAGTWLVSGLSTVTFDPVNHSEASFTTFCKVVVGNNGAFAKKSSSCTSSVGASTISGKMEIVGKTCTVKAFPMKVFVTGQPTTTFTVDSMALDKGKSTFTATGNKDSAITGLAQFIWQGVKQ
ncbi:MAG: hypothetical protein IT492_09910 [Gammaproteobacteria bacterium]|nr:hypothetical protein [Gammaproteobacteria bacterium]